MNPAAHLWVTESNRKTQTLVAAAGTVVGLLLIIGSRSKGQWETETIAAFVLGLGLLVAGLGFLFFSPKQTVTVNSKTRRITIENKHRFGASSKQLRFDEIVDAYVDEVGDKEGGSISYHIVLRLKTGKTVSLFTGFFDGSYSESATEARRQRLLQYVNGTG
jgi:hypothetical protein